MHLTQITLTDRERWLLAQLFAVSSAFLAALYADVPLDLQDIAIISKLEGCAKEIEALNIKLNLDRLEKLS